MTHGEFPRLIPTPHLSKGGHPAGSGSSEAVTPSVTESALLFTEFLEELETAAAPPPQTFRPQPGVSADMARSSARQSSALAPIGTSALADISPLEYQTAFDANEPVPVNGSEMAATGAKIDGTSIIRSDTDQEALPDEPPNRRHPMSEGSSLRTPVETVMEVAEHPPVSSGSNDKQVASTTETPIRPSDEPPPSPPEAKGTADSRPGIDEVRQGSEINPEDTPQGPAPLRAEEHSVEPEPAADPTVAADTTEPDGISLPPPAPSPALVAAPVTVAATDRVARPETGPAPAITVSVLAQPVTGPVVAPQDGTDVVPNTSAARAAPVHPRPADPTAPIRSPHGEDPDTAPRAARRSAGANVQSPTTPTPTVPPAPGPGRPKAAGVAIEPGATATTGKPLPALNTPIRTPLPGGDTLTGSRVTPGNTSSHPPQYESTTSTAKPVGNLTDVGLPPRTSASEPHHFAPRSAATPAAVSQTVQSEARPDIPADPADTRYAGTEKTAPADARPTTLPAPTDLPAPSRPASLPVPQIFYPVIDPISGGDAVGRLHADLASSLPIQSASPPAAPAAIGHTAPSGQTHQPAMAVLIQQIAAQSSTGHVSPIAHDLVVRLDPPELGHIRLHFSGFDTQLVAHVTADRADIADQLRRHGEMLAESLRQAGFGDVNLTFGQGGQDTARQAQFGKDRSARGGESPELVQVAHTALASSAAGNGRVDRRI